MPYVQLAVAIACEIGASSALKATHGFTVLAPSVATRAMISNMPCRRATVWRTARDLTW